MNMKTLKEINEIIYAHCSLCWDYEKAGFIEGISMVKELIDCEGVNATTRNNEHLVIAYGE